jgi:outer membrane lipoprotein-sorting protein
MFTLISSGLELTILHNTFTRDKAQAEVTEKLYREKNSDPVGAYAEHYKDIRQIEYDAYQTVKELTTRDSSYNNTSNKLRELAQSSSRLSSIINKDCDKAYVNYRNTGNDICYRLLESANKMKSGLEYISEMELKTYPKDNTVIITLYATNKDIKTSSDMATEAFDIMRSYANNNDLDIEKYISKTYWESKDLLLDLKEKIDKQQLDQQRQKEQIREDVSILWNSSSTY